MDSSQTSTRVSYCLCDTYWTNEPTAVTVCRYQWESLPAIPELLEGTAIIILYSYIAIAIVTEFELEIWHSITCFKGMNI